LADDEEVSTPEFVQRIAKPRASSRAFTFSALKALFRISGRPEASDSVAGSLQLDISKAMKTGSRQRFSLDEGLRSALQTSG
jgi:UDP-glucose 4-epimerase